MRIAIVFPDFVSCKGVEDYALRLARFLALHHEVHVYANTWEELPTNVTTHKVWAASSPYFLRMLTFAVNSTRGLRKESFDVVNVQSCTSFGGNVVTSHACHKAYWLQCKRASLHGRIRALLNPLHLVALFIWSRLLADQRRWVIAVSKGVKQEIHQLYDFPLDKILVNTPGYHLEKFSLETRTQFRTQTRSHFGFTPEDFVLLFVGNEFRRKGLHLVFEAIKLCSDPRLKCLVVGSPTKGTRIRYEHLARSIASQVCFAGRQAQMERIYAAADVFAFPSTYEAFPAVGVEAAASGLPLLSTRVNGITDYMVDGYNGFYVERSAEDIASKIKAMMRDPEELEHMGKNARISALPYTHSAAAGALLETYELIGRGAPCRAQNELPDAVQIKQT